MRVGVYIDGYNLYYGGRHQFGRGTSGWRWLDVRRQVESVIAFEGSWLGATVERVVYCTARIDAKTNPDGARDQDFYLKALVGSGSVDHIEYGNYVARTKAALLATTDPKTGRPVLHTSSWPVMVKDSLGSDVQDARFMVKYLHLEEKGSDVNVATHLIADVLNQDVDAAVVVSNDSDLALPVRTARMHVPVATLNPRGARTAGALRGDPQDGVGRHWWWQLHPPAWTRNQLPPIVGNQRKPQDW